MNRAEFPLDALRLDRGSSQSLHTQLRDALRLLILSGALKPQTRIPSIRHLSKTLGVSRNTIVSAFDQMTAEGYLESRRGAGCWVADTHALRAITETGSLLSQSPGLSKRGEIMASQPKLQSIPGKVAFHPGIPDTANFPFKVWGAIGKRKSSPGGEDLLGYHDIVGLESLRQNISDYLTISRGVRCDADQIVITTGAQAALDMLARMLLDEGDVVWMEEPGFIGAQGAFKAAGATLAALPVDAEGWQFSLEQTRTSPKIIYVTPSCQHPLGIKMELEDRLSLLEKATNYQAWIVEDDYDGEYSFFGSPIPAMQGLTENAPVIYIGTFSKILFPTLRIGYAVVPKSLATHAKTVLSFTGQHPSLILQATLSQFMSDGHFSRHLNRMRRLYARRRARFLELCEVYVGQWLHPVDDMTGIQITCLSKVPMDDVVLARLARSQGLSLAPLSIYYQSSAPEAGLVMGYAGVDETQMAKSFKVLRSLLQEHVQT